jgi:hypothetical protein
MRVDDILSPDFDDEFDRIVGNRTPEQEAAAKLNGHKRELSQLIINSANHPETAKELAGLLAERLLSNGNLPAKISVNDEGLAVARVAGDEMICVEAHEVCQPVRRKAGRPKKERTNGR